MDLALKKNVDAYHSRIKSLVAARKTSLLKNSIINGRQRGEEHCRHFTTQLKSAFNKSEEYKISLAISLTENIIKEHLHQNPKSIVNMALKLLKNIAEYTDVELNAHPQDAKILNSSLSHITDSCSSLRKVSIIEDHGMTRGSLVVKANKSIIDAHVKTQADKAKELLLKKDGINRGTVN